MGALIPHSLSQLAIVLFVAIFSFSTSALAQNFTQNEITKINISNQNNLIQLKLRLAKTSQYKVFTLSNPNRLIIDFNDTSFVANLGEVRNPLFLSIRQSTNKETLRIVFDLTKPLEIKDSKIIKLGQNQYDLVIDLFSANQVENRYVLNSGELPSKKDTKYVAKKAKALPVIIIDSGHGGKDPGAIGKYIRSREKYITLAYARELKRQLDRTGKFKVFLTRHKDYFIPLNERVELARRNKADLFISLHADSSPSKSTSGFSIYTLSETSSDKQAELLAKKENKSDIIGGADFADASGDILKTLINLSQRSTMNESAKFAEIVIDLIRKHNIETLQKTHRFAGFRILTAPDIPSVLIELGYLSNKDEETKLNSLSHRKKVASALVESIKQYFGF